MKFYYNTYDEIEFGDLVPEVSSAAIFLKHRPGHMKVVEVGSKRYYFQNVEGNVFVATIKKNGMYGRWYVVLGIPEKRKVRL